MTRYRLQYLLAWQLAAILALLPQWVASQTTQPAKCAPVSRTLGGARTSREAPTALKLSTATRKLLRQHQQKCARSVQVGKLLELLEKRDPETLREVDQACRSKAANAPDLVRQVFSVYIELRRLQTGNAAESERVLSIMILEGKCRRLTAKVRRTSPEARRNGVAKEDTLRLKRLLEEIFDSTQANQLIEVNRLEAEVREMRRHLEERGRNRAAILETRLAGLTGADLP
ncbi:MAG: hypothetical protein HN742_00600 [Lentisphaerae bacterium]|nr:hypothetical protein [Lentisphaerota bacterium]MBT4814213.1 hypothetical protein [Lentisphaerota bacterium]MBT5607163.1 hypothetical protein [Lentisphaerota bacterium]MBT7059493.1 hypothetical protein [Lentisphaerota bacterium]MBT7840330.1 hypothetical protein [Lentisphaerota bacterium]